MSLNFEELDRRATPMGEITLRRRYDLSLDREVFEAKLGDEFLMSSLFTAAEVALAVQGLDELEVDGLDVIVGGLGLGYTAQAALSDERVESVHVIEALDEVIDWHRRDLLPLSRSLVENELCHFHQGDFFELVRSGGGFGAGVPRRVHAILLDVDHSPDWTLHPSHADFYQPAGLARLIELLHPGGVFGLWSDAPPEQGFRNALDRVFSSHVAREVHFPNPYTGETSSNTVYVASTYP